MRKLKLQMHMTLDGFSNMEGGGKNFRRTAFRPEKNQGPLARIHRGDQTPQAN